MVQIVRDKDIFFDWSKFECRVDLLLLTLWD